MGQALDFVLSEEPELKPIPAREHESGAVRPCRAVASSSSQKPASVSSWLMIALTA